MKNAKSQHDSIKSSTTNDVYEAFFRPIETVDSIFANPDAVVEAISCRPVAKPLHLPRRANRLGALELSMCAVSVAVTLLAPIVATGVASLFSSYAAATVISSTVAYSMLGLGACGSMVGALAYTRRSRAWRRQLAIVAGCVIAAAMIAACSVSTYMSVVAAA